MRKLLLAFCFASTAFAQQAANDARLLNLPSAALVGPMTLEVLFTHRFSQPVDAAGGENLFGLDGPADVGIGLALGLGRFRQMELYRSSYLKTVELAGKVGLPRQTLGATVAVRGGGVYRLRPVGAAAGRVSCKRPPPGRPVGRWRFSWCPPGCRTRPRCAALPTWGSG